MSPIRNAKYCPLLFTLQHRLSRLCIFQKEWKRVWMILLTSQCLLIWDHLFAEPIFDPNRCSIRVSLLHSYYAIVVCMVLPFEQDNQNCTLVYCFTWQPFSGLPLSSNRQTWYNGKKRPLLKIFTEPF